MPEPLVHPESGFDILETGLRVVGRHARVRKQTTGAPTYRGFRGARTDHRSKAPVHPALRAAPQTGQDLYVIGRGWPDLCRGYLGHAFGQSLAPAPPPLP